MTENTAGRAYRSKRGRLGVLLLLFAVVPALFSSFIIVFFQQQQQLFEKINAFFYICFFSGSVLTMSLALTPTSFVAVLSGFFFKWNGLPGVMLSYLAAMWLGFYLGKKLNVWFVGGYISEDEQLRDFFQRLKQSSFLMVIFGRLSPLLPFAMMNIAFSSINVGWGSYLAGSLIGMLPRTLVFFYTGTKVTEIWSFLKDPTLDGFLSVVPVALIVISTLGLIWLINKSMKQAP